MRWCWETRSTLHAVVVRNRTFRVLQRRPYSAAHPCRHDTCRWKRTPPTGESVSSAGSAEVRFTARRICRPSHHKSNRTTAAAEAVKAEVVVVRATDRRVRSCYSRKERNSERCKGPGTRIGVSRKHLIGTFESRRWRLIHHFSPIEAARIAITRIAWAGVIEFPGQAHHIKLQRYVWQAGAPTGVAPVRPVD